MLVIMIVIGAYDGVEFIIIDEIIIISQWFQVVHVKINDETP